jgi:hypothetical protein
MDELNNDEQLVPSTDGTYATIDGDVELNVQEEPISQQTILDTVEDAPIAEPAEQSPITTTPDDVLSVTQSSNPTIEPVLEDTTSTPSPLTQEEFNSLTPFEQYQELNKREAINAANAVTPDGAVKADLANLFDTTAPVEYDDDGNKIFTSRVAAIGSTTTELTPEDVRVVDDHKKDLQFKVASIYPDSNETKELFREANNLPLGQTIADFAVYSEALSKDDPRYSQIAGLNDAEALKSFPHVFKEGSEEFALFRLEEARRLSYETKPYTTDARNVLFNFVKGSVLGNLFQNAPDNIYTTSLTDKEQRSAMTRDLVLANIAGGITEGVALGGLTGLAAKAAVASKTLKNLPTVLRIAESVKNNTLPYVAVESALLNFGLDRDTNPTLTSIVTDERDNNNNIIALVEGGVAGALGTAVVKGATQLFKNRSALRSALQNSIPVDDIDPVVDGTLLLYHDAKALKLEEINPSIKDVKGYAKTYARILTPDNLEVFKGQESLEQTTQLRELVNKVTTLRDELSVRPANSVEELEEFVSLSKEVEYAVENTKAGRGRTLPISGIKNVIKPITDGSFVTENGETVLKLNEVVGGDIPLTSALKLKQKELLDAAEVVDDVPELFQIGDADTATAIMNLNRVRNSLRPNTKVANELASQLYQESEAGRATEIFQQSLKEYDQKVEAVNNTTLAKNMKYESELAAYNAKLQAPIDKATAKVAEIDAKIKAVQNKLKGVSKSGNNKLIGSTKAQLTKLTKSRDAIKVPTVSQVKKELGLKKPRVPVTPKLPDPPVEPTDVITFEEFKQAFNTTLPKSLDNLSTGSKERIIEAAKVVTDTVGYKTKDIILSTDELLAGIQKANADNVFSPTVKPQIKELLDGALSQSDLKLFKDEWDLAVARAKKYDQIRADRKLRAQPLAESIDKLLDKKPLDELEELITSQEKLRDEYIDAALNAQGRYTAKSKLTGKPMDVVDKQLEELLDTSGNTALYKQASGMQAVIREVYSQGGSAKDLVDNAYSFAVRAHKAIQKKTTQVIDGETLSQSIYNNSALGYSTSLQKTADTLGIPYTKLLDDVIKRGGNTVSHLAQADAINSVHTFFSKQIKTALTELDNSISTGGVVDSTKLYTALKDLAAFRMQIGRAEEYLNLDYRDSLFNLLERVSAERADVQKLSSSMQDFTKAWNREQGLPEFIYPDEEGSVVDIINTLLTDGTSFDIHKALSSADTLFQAKQPIAKEIMTNLFKYAYDVNIAKMLSGLPVAKLAAVSNTILTSASVAEVIVGGALRKDAIVSNTGHLMLKSLARQVSDFNEIKKFVEFTGKSITSAKNAVRFAFDDDTIEALDILYKKIPDPRSRELMLKLNKAGKIGFILARSPLTSVDGMTAKIAGTMQAEAEAIVEASKQYHPSSPAFSKFVQEFVDERVGSLLENSRELNATQKFVSDITLTRPLPENATLNKHGLAIALGSMVNRTLESGALRHPVLKAAFSHATLFSTTLSNAADRTMSYIPLALPLTSVGRAAKNGDSMAQAVSAARQLSGTVGLATMIGLFASGAVKITPVIRTAKDYRDVSITPDNPETSLIIGDKRISLREAGVFAPLITGIGYFTELIQSEIDNYSDPILQDQLGLGQDDSLAGQFNDAKVVANSVMNRRFKDVLYGAALFSGLNYLGEFAENLSTAVSAPVGGAMQLLSGKPQQLTEWLGDLAIPTWVQQSLGEHNKMYSPFFDGHLNYAMSIGDKSAQAKVLNRLGKEGSAGMFGKYDLFGRPKPEESVLAIVKDDNTPDSIRELFRLRAKNPKAFNTEFTDYKGFDSRNMFINGVNVFKIRNSILSTVTDAQGRTFDEAMEDVVKSEEYAMAADVRFKVKNGGVSAIKQVVDTQSKVGMLQREIDYFHNLADEEFTVRYKDSPVILREGSQEINLQDRLRLDSAATEAARYSTQQGNALYKDVKSLGYINSL